MDVPFRVAYAQQSQLGSYANSGEMNKRGIAAQNYLKSEEYDKGFKLALQAKDADEGKYALVICYVNEFGTKSSHSTAAKLLQELFETRHQNAMTFWVWWLQKKGDLEEAYQVTNNVIDFFPFKEMFTIAIEIAKKLDNKNNPYDKLAEITMKSLAAKMPLSDANSLLSKLPFCHLTKDSKSYEIRDYANSLPNEGDLVFPKMWLYDWASELGDLPSSYLWMKLYTVNIKNLSNAKIDVKKLKSMYTLPLLNLLDGDFQKYFMIKAHCAYCHDFDDQIANFFGLPTPDFPDCEPNLPLYFHLSKYPNRIIISLVSDGANPKGTPFNMLCFAICLEHGFGIEKDPSTAISFYIHLSDNYKYQESTLYLGYLAENGILSEHGSIKKAMHYYKACPDSYYANEKVRELSPWVDIDVIKKKEILFQRFTEILCITRELGDQMGKGNVEAIYIAAKWLYFGNNFTIQDKNYAVELILSTSNYKNYPFLISLLGVAAYEETPKARENKFTKKDGKEMIRTAKESSKNSDPFYFDIISNAILLSLYENKIDDVDKLRKLIGSHDTEKTLPPTKYIKHSKDIKGYWPPNNFNPTGNEIDVYFYALMKPTADSHRFDECIAANIPEVITSKLFDHESDAKKIDKELNKMLSNHKNKHAIFEAYTLIQLCKEKKFHKAYSILAKAHFYGTLNGDIIPYIFSSGMLKKIEKHDHGFNYRINPYILKKVDPSVCKNDEDRPSFLGSITFECVPYRDYVKSYGYYQESKKSLTSKRGIAFILMNRKVPASPNEIVDAAKSANMSLGSNSYDKEMVSIAKKHEFFGYGNISPFLMRYFLRSESGSLEDYAKLEWFFWNSSSPAFQEANKSIMFVKTAKTTIGKIGSQLVNPSHESWNVIMPYLQRNNPYANFVAGFLTMNGIGARIHPSLAAQYFDIAEMGGITEAAHYLFKIYPMLGDDNDCLDPDDEWIYYCRLTQPLQLEEPHSGYHISSTHGGKAYSALKDGNLKLALDELTAEDNFLKDKLARHTWSKIVAKGLCSNVPRESVLAMIYSNICEFNYADDHLLLCKCLFGKYDFPYTSEKLLHAYLDMNFHQGWAKYFFGKYFDKPLTLKEAAKQGFQKAVPNRNKNRKIQISSMDAPTSLLNRIKAPYACSKENKKPQKDIDTACAYGNIFAIFFKAQLMARNILYEKDTEFVSVVMKLLMLSDFAPAFTEYGYYLKVGYGCVGDQIKGFRFLSEGARKGDQRGIFKVALCKLFGEGTEIDQKGAIQMLQECKHPDSYFVLSYCYKNGIGVHVNEQKSDELFDKGVKKGSKLCIKKAAKSKSKYIDAAAHNFSKWALMNAKELSSIAYYAQKTVKKEKPASIFAKIALKEKDKESIIHFASKYNPKCCKYILENFSNDNSIPPHVMAQCLYEKALERDRRALFYCGNHLYTDEIQIMINLFCFHTDNSPAALHACSKYVVSFYSDEKPFHDELLYDLKLCPLAMPFYHLEMLRYYKKFDINHFKEIIENRIIKKNIPYRSYLNQVIINLIQDGFEVFENNEIYEWFLEYYLVCKDPFYKYTDHYQEIEKAMKRVGVFDKYDLKWAFQPDLDVDSTPLKIKIVLPQKSPEQIAKEKREWELYLARLMRLQRRKEERKRILNLQRQKQRELEWQQHLAEMRRKPPKKGFFESFIDNWRVASAEADAKFKIQQYQNGQVDKWKAENSIQHYHYMRDKYS